MGFYYDQSKRTQYLVSNKSSINAILTDVEFRLSAYKQNNDTIIYMQREIIRPGDIFIISYFAVPYSKSEFIRAFLGKDFAYISVR